MKAFLYDFQITHFFSYIFIDILQGSLKPNSCRYLKKDPSIEISSFVVERALSFLLKIQPNGAWTAQVFITIAFAKIAYSSYLFSALPKTHINIYSYYNVVLESPVALEMPYVMSVFAIKET
jgi:hypothetical protein